LWRESTTPNCATGLQVIGFFSSTQDSRLRQAIASEIENYKSKLKSSTPVFSFHFATQWTEFSFCSGSDGKGEEGRRYRMEWGDGIEGDFITPDLYAILRQKLVHEKYAGIYTDKKENQIFLISKKIQSGAVAKSYMRKGFLIYCMRKSSSISPYMRRPLAIYDFATAPF
jgi:hypothetical protein